MAHVVAAVVLILLMLPSSSLGAEKAESRSSIPESPFAFSTAATYSARLFRYDNSQRESQADFSVGAEYRLDSDWSLGLDLGFTKELNGERRNFVEDGSLSLEHSKIPLSNSLQFLSAASFVLPISKASRKKSGLVTALTLSPGISADLSTIGLNHLSAFYSLGATRAFHKHTTAVSGTPLKKWNFNNTVGMKWRPSSRLSVSASATRSLGWTYEGTKKHNFGIAQKIKYRFNSHVSALLAHSNFGDVLKENGQDSNISIVNKRQSVISTGLIATF